MLRLLLLPLQLLAWYFLSTRGPSREHRLPCYSPEHIASPLRLRLQAHHYFRSAIIPRAQLLGRLLGFT
jgi:hypothetical protein